MPSASDVRRASKTLRARPLVFTRPSTPSRRRVRRRRAPMGELRESSVLFSLNGLMELERDRQREEDEAARAKAEAEAAAHALMHQLVREEMEATRRGEQARREADEARAREEAARLAAMQAATIERARIEAERAAALARQVEVQRHERELARLREDVGHRRLRRALIVGGACAFVAIAASLGLYFGELRPESAAREAEHAATLARLEGEKDHLAAEAHEKDARAAVLAAEARAAGDEVTRAKAARDKAEAERDAAAKKRVPSRSGATPRVNAKRDVPCNRAACVNPGDPQCDCLD
ncbi:MAG TPA: hypothetical protein VGM56_33380 [Byssovorax sp.]